MVLERLLPVPFVINVQHHDPRHRASEEGFVGVGPLTRPGGAFSLGGDTVLKFLPPHEGAFAVGANRDDRLRVHWLDSVVPLPVEVRVAMNTRSARSRHGGRPLASAASRTSPARWITSRSAQLGCRRTSALKKAQ